MTELNCTLYCTEEKVDDTLAMLVINTCLSASDVLTYFIVIYANTMNNNRETKVIISGQRVYKLVLSSSRQLL